MATELTAKRNKSSVENEFDDSDDSDDDEEFLTIGSGGGRRSHASSTGRSAGGMDSAVDREALVRKKLLENFYGKSAVVAAMGSSPRAHRKGSGVSDDDSDDGASGRKSFGGREGRDGDAEADDLDSPGFDVEAHTRRHVVHSSVRDLLETEERLALEVRTLDSTTQTLVYENYSRFIDATDAIRSIGSNVTANQDGLQALVDGMAKAQATALRIEDELGSLRDQVAEKIRIKRLLTRLDSLLRLPETLRANIREGKYRAAVQSYLSAVSILSKHSAGFESLRAIEAECNSIVDSLQLDLRRRLLRWSGRHLMAVEDSYESGDGLGGGTTTPSVGSSAIPPSRGLADVFEAAGALLMLVEDCNRSAGELALEENGDGSDLILDRDELQSLSLSSSTRCLDRLLDSHLIRVQDRRFSPLVDAPSSSMNASAAAMDGFFGGSATISVGSFGNSSSGLALPGLQHAGDEQGSPLIPVDFLRGVLEALALYRATFGDDGGSGDGNSTGLVEFVSEAFSTFLVHVRAVLLEESTGGTAPGGDGEIPMAAGRDDEAAQREVSSALALLLSSVQNLADHLTAADSSVWNPGKAQQFVDRAMALTESMVRRRVDRTFFQLRVTVVQNCLIPFVERVAAETSEGTNENEKWDPLQSVVQLGGSALSDCLQLVDDTIRAVFSSSGPSNPGGVAVGASSGQSLPILKQAVEASACRFAAWLASTLEVLAEGESSDPHIVMEAPMDYSTVSEVGMQDASPRSDKAPRLNNVLAGEEKEDWAAEHQTIMALIDEAISLLLRANQVSNDDESGGEGSVASDFILGVAEVCRLAQSSVAESLEQSICTYGLGTSKKKPRGLFPANTASGVPSSHIFGNDDSVSAIDVSRYFEMAASRLVASFALQRGTRMAELYCQHLPTLLHEEELSFPPGPSEGVYRALEVAKVTCMECACLYGGPARAGPVPGAEELGLSAPSRLLSTPASMRSGRASAVGVMLDVERIFREKMIIYPHPRERFTPSRDLVLFVAFKVALRAVVEYARMAAPPLAVTPAGLRQVLVDFEFVKVMIPHYVGRDYSVQGSFATRALSGLVADIVSSSGDLCIDPELADDEGAKEEAWRAVRLALDGIEESEFGSKFIIHDG
jgi:hypothetical protein